MDVHRPSVRESAIAPDRPEEFVAQDHASAVANQKGQHLVFAPREVYTTSSPADSAVVKIDGHISEFEYRNVAFVLWSHSPEERFHASE